MVCLPTGTMEGASCVLFYQSGRRSRHPRVPSTGKASTLSCEFLLFSRTNSRALGGFFRCSRSGRGELPGIDPLAASSRPLFIGSSLRMDHPCTGGDQRGVSDPNSGSGAAARQRSEEWPFYSAQEDMHGTTHVVIARDEHAPALRGIVPRFAAGARPTS